MNKSIEKKLIRIFLILSIGMYVFLSAFSFVISWVNTELHEEHLTWVKDSLLTNVIGLIIAWILFSLVQKYSSKISEKINMDVVALIVAFIMAGLSIWWALTVNTSPVDDQRKICYSASYINSGDYHLFEKGQYLAECPHQLGLVTLMRVLFILFGDGNYSAFRVLSSLSIALSVFSGYKIVSNFTDKKSSKTIYLVLVACCLPIYFYAPYVYGELLSIAFLLCSCWMILELIDCFKVIYLITYFFMIFLSIMVRKNSLIPIIAIFIVLIIRLIFDRKLKFLLLIGFTFLSILCHSVLIKELYKDCVKEDAKEVPSILYVAMGMSDEARHAGWYDGSSFRIFEDNDCNPEVASAIGMDVINDFLITCKADPKLGLNFYMRKITAQWDAPMYQSIVMNHNVDGKQGKLAEWIYTPEKSWKYLDAWMNIHQIIIFLSILVWLIKSWKNPGEMQMYLVHIAIYGGFLFSIIWEAKSRYVFPYYVMMIPMAALAVGTIFEYKITYKK